MNNLWKINGLDMYGQYGAALLRGSYTDLMTPPVPRKRLEHDFTDRNGVEIDESSPLSYESARCKIKVVITGATEIDYWANLAALLTEIAKPQPFALYVAELSTTFTLHYEGAVCTSKRIRLKNGRVAIAYDISVLEKNPTNRVYE